MNVYLLSDTHGHHQKVKFPDAHIDLVVHCGDATNFRSPTKNLVEMTAFCEWYSQINCPKIYVPGNHDAAMYRHEQLIKDSYPNIKFLVHDYYEFNGLRIFGSPYTPEFGSWYFSYLRDDDKFVDQIPDCDLLITHGPPFGIFDISEDFNNPGKNISVGCKLLRKKVLEIEPRVHAFGHIHSSNKIFNRGVQYRNSTRFINCAMLEHGGNFNESGFLITI